MWSQPVDPFKDGGCPEVRGRLRCTMGSNPHPGHGHDFWPMTPWELEAVEATKGEQHEEGS